MKRYLIKGAYALLAGLFITSCSRESEVSFTPIQEQKASEFEEAFKEAFTSNIASNQDWGFKSTSRAATRALTRDGDPEVVKKDVWQNFPDKLDGNTVPDDVTDDEAKFVYDWFKEHPNLSTEGKPWTHFFIQQVYGTMDQQKQGIWKKSTGDEDFYDKGGMDYLTVGNGTIMTHVNDFNAEAGGPWGIVYMRNSSAMKFGYHGSWDNSDRMLFKLAQITVPGRCFPDKQDRVGWYVGLSLLAEKYDNGDKILGYQRQNYGDDWILKIVPGNGASEEEETPDPEETTDEHVYKAKTVTTKTEYYKSRTLLQYGRVFCEDLGGNYKSNRKDFDYNDVVFDAYLWKEEQCKKVTQVTTYEVNTYKIVTETVHKYVDGVPQYEADGTTPITEEQEVEVLVSTTTQSVEGESTTSIVANTAPRFYADICLLACGATKPIKVGSNDNAKEVHYAFGGYSVDCIINTFDEHTVEAGGFGYHETAEPVKFEWMDITDVIEDNTNPTIADIPVYVQWNGISAFKVQAPTGEAPQKFMSTAKDKWTSERCFLGDAYPNFGNWAERPDHPFSLGASDNHLYLGYPGPDAGLSFSNLPSAVGVAVAQPIETSKTTYEETTDNSLVRNVLENGEAYTPGTYPAAEDVVEVSSEVSLWTGTQTPNWYGSVVINFQPLITSTSGTIRFYGTLTNTTDPWITVFLDGNQILDCKFEEPYVTLSVTDNIRTRLNQYANITINGQQFTLTGISWAP